MPQVATRTQNANKELIAYDIISTGISITSKNLSESLESSMKEFFTFGEAKPSRSFPLATSAVSILRKPLRETLTKIHNLLSLGANWNSYDALPPDPHAVMHAKSWIMSLFQKVEDLGLPWIKPSVSASPEGEVVFEWRYNKKKLTIYVGEQNIDYVQVWGTDIHSEMSNGNAEPMSTCRMLWLWLTN